MQLTEQDVILRLRDFGHRITNQKRVIIKNIMNNPNSTAKEICYLSKQNMPDINLSTVYRTVTMLEKAGLLGERNISLCSFTTGGVYYKKHETHSPYQYGRSNQLGAVRAHVLLPVPVHRAEPVLFPDAHVFSALRFEPAQKTRGFSRRSFGGRKTRVARKGSVAFVLRDEPRTVVFEFHQLGCALARAFGNGHGLDFGVLKNVRVGCGEYSGFVGRNLGSHAHHGVRHDYIDSVAFVLPHIQANHRKADACRESFRRA